jgi:ketosteroid isomerase-like protein
MSQENMEVAREPVRVRERSSGSLAQRIALRFPRLSDAYARLLARFPPTSRFPQAAPRLPTRDGVEAWNRRDLDALLLVYHPDCEHYPPREFVEGGLWERCYRGHAGYAKLMAAWSDTGTEARLAPTELIDLGAHVVSLSELSARTSRLAGAPLTRTYATVWTIEDGKIRSQREETDNAEALEAVGLSE